MKHVKTSAGFEAEIDEGCFDDLELLDAVVALEAGDSTVLSLVLDKVLGEAKTALYDFVRDEKGRVPVKTATAIVTEIFQELAPKNG